MPPKAPRADALIKRHVRINDDATTGKGKPLPEAGKMGKIIGRTPGGKQYQVEVGDTLINLTMDSFTVLDHDPSAPRAAAVATTPKAVAGPTLKVDHIVPSTTNRKNFDPEGLQLLAASIKAYGVLQPLLVRRLPASRLQETFEDPETRHATHEIIAGERRWRAARIAGIAAVPYLESTADGALPQVMQLLENIQREDLKPLDEARGIEALISDHGYTRPQVAEALGRGLTHVFESQRLLQLCPDAIAALQGGTLTRSVALLVAQRPTPALQAEFTKRVLTTGPEGGPMSYRSAKDLAARQYQTDLATAPFTLTDAALCPKAGACSQCHKRTGAAPELFDKNHADVCTDVACFNGKKEAHYDALTAKARENNRKVITGKEARELMPTEGVAPTGYMLLDKPLRKGDTAPLRSLVGTEVPPEKVVLIESPSGAMVEAVAVRTASAALEAKGKAPAAKSEDKAPAKALTASEVADEYQRRWRTAAVGAVIEGLRVDADPKAMDILPAPVAYRVMLTMAREINDEPLCSIFNLSPKFSDESLKAAVAKASDGAYRLQNMVLMMLAASFDTDPLYDRPVDEALHLDATAPLAKVDLQAIQAKVKEEMRNEATERAEAAKPKPKQADKAKPTLKTDKPAKTSKADASAAIAKAMQEATDAPAFTAGQAVTIKTDLKGPNGGIVSTNGCAATVVRASGTRRWVVTLLDPWPFPGKKAEPMEITADYTELEAR